MNTLASELIQDRSEAAAAEWALPKRVPELDGIRGLAILMVMACHASSWIESDAWRIFFQHGRIGVDLFFVLSGFLITGILLDTRDERNRTKNFYIRRGLRIWPLYFLFLFVALIAFHKMLPPEPRLWLYVLCIQNFFFFLGHGPFLDPTWSLAVEEQFYAVWPWLAFRVEPTKLLKVCWGVILGSPFIRVTVQFASGSADVATMNTFCRLDALAIGAAVAVWIRHSSFQAQHLNTFGRWSAIIGSAGAVLTLALQDVSVIARALSHSFLAFAFCGMVAITLHSRGNGVSTEFLQRRWLRYIGQVSFALYLFNYPIYVVMHGNFVLRGMGRIGLGGAAAEIAIFVLENVVLLTAASLSWKLLEHPMLELKSRLAPR